MRLRYVCIALCLGLRPFALFAAEGTVVSTKPVSIDTAATETPGLDAAEKAQDSESGDIIPPNADILTSTTPVTPITDLTEKAPYDQGRDDLIRALELYNGGHMEAASDTALQAYDDFIALHRVKGVKRSEIRKKIHQSADVYIRASIAYIRDYLHRAGSTPEAIEESRARLDDLHDVARDYPELTRLLNAEFAQLGSPKSSSSK